MKTLMGLLLVLGAGTLLARFALVSVEDSGLREDLIFAPQVETTHAANAGNIARAVMKRAAEHGCTPEPDGVQVHVYDSVEGVLTVQGAGGQLRGQGPKQQVDISLRCTRKGIFFVPETITLDIATGTMGAGTEEFYPPAEQE